MPSHAKTQSIRVPTPAKLNLFLHITDQRADGYHDLETCFLFTQACDWIELSANQSGEVQIDLLSSSEQAHPLDEGFFQDNLISRAAALLKTMAQEQGVDESTLQVLGARIQIQKNLPLGGGLGGGSSNAAGALLALNKLWELGLNPELIAARSVTLGADVPVFVRGHTAWATGLGDQLAYVHISELFEDPVYAAVLTPKAQVTTAKLFAHPELIKDSIALGASGFPNNKNQYHNCFEPLLSDHASIQQALNHLKTYDQKAALSARLTGTGACVYSLFSTLKQAESCLGSAPCNGFVTPIVDCSVLHQKLGLEPLF